MAKISTIRLRSSSGDEYEEQLVLFEVERSYRGWGAKAAEVLTGNGGGDCGYQFREGLRYLVYAFPHHPSGKLYTGICQRTRPLTDATADLEYLERKDDPSYKAGIEGIIEKLDAKDRIQVQGVLRGIPVLVEGPSGSWRVVSQDDGRFKLWGLPPGRYSVAPVLPGSFLSVEQAVTLKRNTCAELRFLATPRPEHRNPGSRPHER